MVTRLIALYQRFDPYEKGDLFKQGKSTPPSFSYPYFAFNRSIQKVLTDVLSPFSGSHSVGAHVYYSFIGPEIGRAHV